MDRSLVIGLGLLAGQWAILAPSAVLIGVMACALGLRRVLSPVAILLLGLSVVIGAWRARRAVSAFESERLRVRAAIEAPARCEASGTVVRSPVLYASRPATGFEANEPGPDTLSWDAQLDRVRCENGARLESVRARIYGDEIDIGRGDRFELVADLGATELWRNDGLEDPKPRAARRGLVLSGRAVDVNVGLRSAGVGATIDRLRAHVRRRIQATFVPAASALARALVLGETDLDPEDDRVFRASGLSHLLAVSGTHLVLAVVTVVNALHAFLKRMPALSGRCDVGRIAAAGGIVLAWAYADFAGGSGPALRAASMLSIGFLARAVGRRPCGTRSFGLSMTLGAVSDPLAANDASFVLSLAATAGLLLLQGPTERAFGAMLVSRHACADRVPRWARWCAPALATTTAASVGCAPLIVLLSPTLPVGGLFANLLAVPVGELAALPVCLLHALCGPIVVLERGAALVGSGSLLAVRAVAHATADLEWLAVPIPAPTQWELAALCATAAFLHGMPRSRLSVALVGLSAMLLLEVVAVRAGVPHGRLRITFLDVGQGDSALIDLPSGGAMLVDGGGALGVGLDPGRVVVAPMLRARRRRALDVVVLTHPHPDHFGGLAAALADVHVAEFWDNGQTQFDSAGAAYDALVGDLRSRGARVRLPSELCGAPRDLGGATVSVLSPCPGPLPSADANDNSIVLRIAYGARAALLVGDAAFAAESHLLANLGPALHADVLKVGHHGSRTSSSGAFIESVAPHHAVISCGARNRFGHPHPRTLAKLLPVAEVLRTDRAGSISWETDGSGVWVSVADAPAP